MILTEVLDTALQSDRLALQDPVGPGLTTEVGAGAGEGLHNTPGVSETFTWRGVITFSMAEVEMVRKKSRKETLLPFAIIGLADNEWFKIEKIFLFFILRSNYNTLKSVKTFLSQLKTIPGCV